MLKLYSGIFGNTQRDVCFLFTVQKASFKSGIEWRARMLGELEADGQQDRKMSRCLGFTVHVEFLSVIQDLLICGHGCKLQDYVCQKSWQNSPWPLLSLLDPCHHRCYPENMVSLFAKIKWDRSGAGDQPLVESIMPQWCKRHVLTQWDVMVAEDLEQ